MNDSWRLDIWYGAPRWPADLAARSNSNSQTKPIPPFDSRPPSHWLPHTRPQPPSQTTSLRVHLFTYSRSRYTHSSESRRTSCDHHLCNKSMWIERLFQRRALRTPRRPWPCRAAEARTHMWDGRVAFGWRRSIRGGWVSKNPAQSSCAFRSPRPPDLQLSLPLTLSLNQCGMGRKRKLEQ